MRWLALAAALAAAALLPGERLGLGVVLVAGLVVAAAAAARRPSRSAFAFGALALALASFAALLDAGWVVTIDLVAAWLTASVAVSGPRVAAVPAPLARLRDARTVAPSTPRGLAPALRGAVLGGFLVVPFATLFLAADAAFAELGKRIPSPAVDSLSKRALVFALVLVAALALALAARRPPEPATPRQWKRLAPAEWAIPLALLVLLFASFVVVQLTVLFGGHDHVLTTARLTYAEYARQGFWELLAAALLTLCVIAAAALTSDTPRLAHRLLLRALLGALCALTLVILASALHRLRLYEDAFGLTRLRLVAEATAVWLGGAFALVLLAGVAQGVRRRLPSLAVAGTAAALIAFSLANPDALIARRNVEHLRDSGRIDVDYLSRLSADAVPALVALPNPLRERALARLSGELAAGDPWSAANLSRRRARNALRAQRRSAAESRSRSPRPRRMRRSPLRPGTSG
jgi:Domain of unknown function (DUF4153)